MSIREHFEMCRKAFGPNIYSDFLLAHGVAYMPGPDTFAAPRQEQHNCFGNALHLALDDPSLTYVEGKVSVHGVPLSTEYVKRAVLFNGVYGVLDYFYAGKTAPKLFELGLQAGQQWLLDQVKPKRRSRAKKEQV